jgi:ATP-dependent RNA helicase HelY
VVAVVVAIVLVDQEGEKGNSMYSDFPVHKILAELSVDNLLPAILFRSSRRQCDEDIDHLGRSSTAKLNAEQREKLVNGVETAMGKYNMDPTVIRNHPQYDTLTRCGVGAHHAGQLLLWRLILEELMSRGLLKMMIATGTVAAGVDFPARTVVITAHSKRGNDGFRTLTASEFQQMSGRAGRRGRDTVGICVMAPSIYCDARVLLDVSKSPPEPLRSSYFAAPATVLNLLRYRNVEELTYTVKKSLAAFLDRRTAERLRGEAHSEERALGETETPLSKTEGKKIRRKLREADEIEARQTIALEKTLQALRTLGHLDDKGLTEKGLWSANLCTSLVLELSEVISSHMLDDLTEIELVGVIGSLAGDPHRSYFNLKPNPVTKKTYQILAKHIAAVKAIYSNPVTQEIAVVPDAGLTAMSWMESTSWEEYSALLKLAGVADGDVSRVVTQTADHLNQICRLADTHPELARKASNARIMLLRPPLSEAIQT